MMSKFTKILLIVMSLLVILSLFLSLSAYFSINEGQWVCVAEECSEWVYPESDDWVLSNCRPEGPTKELWCQFNVDGRLVKAPYTTINKSNKEIRSCKANTCFAEVLIKKTKTEDDLK